jgi:hypothetical protein
MRNIEAKILEPCSDLSHTQAHTRTHTYTCEIFTQMYQYRKICVIVPLVELPATHICRICLKFLQLKTRNYRQK